MKRTILGVLVGALVALVGVMAYGRLFDQAQRGPEWTVATYSGEVLASLVGRPWEAVALKMRLQGSDRLRTLDAAEAMLLHGSSHVTIRPRSELSVANLTKEASRFQVTEGVIQVEARGSRISLRTDTGTTVETKDAGLGVSVKPDGFVHLQVARGSAEFSSMGRTEIVGEGQESTARAGQPPTKPVAIPLSILLNVRFPDAETFNTRLAHVEGRTAPGHRVQVAGRWVDVDDSGAWSAEVELAEGVNQIDVAATDGLGRSAAETSAPIRVDTRAPGLTGVRFGARTVEAGAHERGPARGAASGGPTGGRATATGG